MAKNGAHTKAPPKVLYLRDVPVEILRRARAWAALNGISVKAVVLEALEDYLKKKGA